MKLSEDNRTAALLASPDFRKGDVAVTITFDQRDNGRQLTFAMAGRVRAPMTCTEHLLLAFEDYPNWFSFVRAVHPLPGSSDLKITASLLSHTLSSVVQYTYDQGELHFAIIEGTLHGATGTVFLKESGADFSTVILNSHITRPSFPVPDFLIRWGARHLLAYGAGKFIKRVERSWVQSPET